MLRLLFAWFAENKAKIQSMRGPDLPRCKCNVFWIHRVGVMVLLCRPEMRLHLDAVWELWSTVFCLAIWALCTLVARNPLIVVVCLLDVLIVLSLFRLETIFGCVCEPLQLYQRSRVPPDEKLMRLLFYIFLLWQLALKLKGKLQLVLHAIHCSSFVKKNFKKEGRAWCKR